MIFMLGHSKNEIYWKLYEVGITILFICNAIANCSKMLDTRKQVIEMRQNRFGSNSTHDPRYITKIKKKR
jgi:hypothetical protein